ncbi:GNAT family N-acetyltransferase [Arthrobacter sp. HS15c]|uniref:GNAT family N-acetyltransferase n=1 Tax=Arthrobacter sp. HS15c TaxID=3230279 RepID=UPI0034661DDF
MSRSPDVRLADVDEPMLERLLALAMDDASPDEVTPPLGVGTGWNAERIDWFRAYHRAAAAGLDGPAREKSWAVLCDGSPAGSVRLKRTGPDSVETGIWLGRNVRGQGIGRTVIRLVAAKAASAGAAVLVAETTAGNEAAQGLLRSAGATLVRGPGAVTARLELR